MDVDDIVSFLILSLLFVLTAIICIITGFEIYNYFLDKNVVCNGIQYEKVTYVELSKGIFKFYNPEKNETLFFNAADCKIISN